MNFRDALRRDAGHMMEAMERTVNRCDIWQDRIIYWMAVAIYTLIQIELRRIKE